MFPPYIAAERLAMALQRSALPASMEAKIATLLLGADMMEGSGRVWVEVTVVLRKLEDY